MTVIERKKSTSKNFQDIYLDKNGRIVVNKLGMIFPKKSLVKMDREINMILEEKYLYSSYPVFTMVETTENTVNVEKKYIMNLNRKNYLMNKNRRNLYLMS